MVEISAEEIIKIHAYVVEWFKISQGVINKGVLEAITKRPELKIGNDEYVYKNVFSRAAALMESIIRWHPVAGGNKRTALLTTIFYLKLEGYGVAVPLSAVRYTVKIAKNDKTDEKNTRKLINEIATWLMNHSGRTERELTGKATIFLLIPYRFLGFLVRIGLKNYVKNKISYWMAFDIYPEYEKEARDIIKFIDDTVAASLNVFKEQVY